jgi:hypothetical protein
MVDECGVESGHAVRKHKQASTSWSCACLFVISRSHAMLLRSHVLWRNESPPKQCQHLSLSIIIVNNTKAFSVEFEELVSTISTQLSRRLRSAAAVVSFEHIIWKNERGLNNEAFCCCWSRDRTVSKARSLGSTLITV